MDITAIIIFKWAFMLAAVWLSYYHYRREIRKINLISHKLNDTRLVRSLKSSARSRMVHFLIFFSAFIVWILSYDLANEDVNRQNVELSQELQENTSVYNNLVASQKRLVSASKNNTRDIIFDTKNFYTDILANYYVMRRCQLSGKDDIFIINSALMREIALNSIPIGLRDEIFKNAKKTYISQYADYDCTELNGKYKEISSTYTNYIAAVREIMSATF